jgi:hypothetical protein
MFKCNENLPDVLDSGMTMVSQSRRQMLLLLLREAGLIISMRTHQEVLDPMRNAKPGLNVKATHLAGCRWAWLNVPKNC